VTISRFYNKIAVISWKSSDYDRALEYHRKAIEINKEGFRERLAHSYNNIALVHMDLGEYEKALEYLLKALEINEKANEKLRITPALLNNIGWVHHNLKNYQIALEFFSKSLALKEKIGDKHGKANVFIDMGDTYRKLQDHQKALQCYQNARKLYDELEEKRGIANALDRIGNIYNDSNQHDSALNYYSQSLKINRELGDKQAIAGSILNTTRAYKHLDKYPEALEQAQNALAIAEEIKAKRLIGEILEEIAGIYTEMKDFGKTLTYYKKYKQHNESIFNEETGKKIAELQIKYETEKNEKEIVLLKREKDISLLELSKQTNIRNFLIVVCVLILVLTIVVFYSYRSKVKINLKLKEEIAHHQETSAKLREMERERFKNKNLESIGVLAGGIAHDFNNLLSVIIGSISLAKECTSSGEEELVLLDRAEQFSMQAANLAGKLLTFSKGDMLIRKKSDLSHLLQKAIDFEPPDRRYTIQLDITDPLMPIYGDERQLVPAFSNIIQKVFKKESGWDLPSAIPSFSSTMVI
jgi:tetratricopeptide (TPR) repeat protein